MRVGIHQLLVVAVLSVAMVHCAPEKIVESPKSGSGKNNNHQNQSTVNHAPAPTANPIVVSAGQTGTTTVNPNDADANDTHTFSIVEAPANGSASVSNAGVVTYTPNGGFVGTDLLRVRVTDQGGLSGEVAIDVTVQSTQPGNRAPRPTAASIVVIIGEVAETQVNHNDPDGGDTHTYAIVQPPSRGSASISNSGRVTYSAGDMIGQDSLRVRVTDSGGLSGEVTIAVSIDAAPYDRFGELPPAVCGDGYTRIKLARITPEPGTMLLSGVPVTFNVRVSYSVPAMTYIATDPPVTSTTLPSGCGTLEMSGMVTPPVNSSFTIGLLYDSDSDNVPDRLTSDGYQYYPIDATDAIAGLRFEKVAFPTTGVVDSPVVEVGAWLSADLHGDWDIDYNNYLEIVSIGGFAGFYNPYMYAVVAPLSSLPMRLRTLRDCGESEAVWLLNGYGASWVGSSETRLVLPAVPPSITVNQFTTRFPVNGTDVSQSISVLSCVGLVDVTISSSSPWFDVQPTQATLDTSNALSLDITWLGGQIAAGSQVAGELVIAANDSSFTVRIPVSARGFNYPLYNPDYPGSLTMPPAGYFVRLPNTNYSYGADDDYDIVNLSFNVPDGQGGTTNQVSVNSNGTLFIGSYTGAPYNIPNGDFSTIYPSYYGMPMFSFVGTDNGFFAADRDGDLEHEAAIYFREVTDVTGQHAEFLWWDLDSYEDSRTHNVFLVRLYPDGTVWVKFDQLDANGFEQFASWAADGTLIDYIPIWQVEEGVWYQLGPIP